MKILFGNVDNLSALKLAENYLVWCFLLASVKNQKPVEMADEVHVLLARVCLVKLRVTPLDAFFSLNWVNDLVDLMGSHWQWLTNCSFLGAITFP